MVRAVNPGIALRVDPGLDAERVGALAEGSRSLVLDGPVAADGYSWYLLSGPGLPPSSGCTTPLPTEPLSCPIWLGWAAAGPDHAWFVEDPTECPDPATEADRFALLGDFEALHCYAGEELVVTGWLQEYASTPDPAPCPTGTQEGPAGWLWCHERWWEALYVPPDQALFIELIVDPASGITLPHDGRLVTVRGRLDHELAEQCAASVLDGGQIRPEDAVRTCRSRFVVASIEDAQAP